MNPNQVPGVPTPGTPNPPQLPVRPSPDLSVPPRATEVPARDIPEAAFGFEDEPLPSAPAQPATTNPLPLISPATSVLPTPIAPPAPAPVPIVPPAPQAVSLPAPTPAPLPPQPTAAPPAPMPAEALPPPVPTVPTLNPAVQTPPPTPTSAAPSPEGMLNAQPLSVAAKPFESSPAKTAAATYSPQPATHVPQDIAQRIGETPIQNSNDVVKDTTHRDRIKSFVSFLIFGASIFIAAFLINQFIFQSYYVEGTSMVPTLQNNDRLIISKVERTWAAVTGQPYIPARGQIVVLDSSIVGFNGQHEQLIKRVIGLPGDHVHIENGNVTITNAGNPNGFDVARQLGLTYLAPTASEAVVDITVPDGQVYVMGDNRVENASYDSRSFGPVEGDKIQGRLWARILPVDKAQLY